jgi:preprotein translocase subunit SecB
MANNKNSKNSVGELKTKGFIVHAQYLKDLSFENPNPLAYLTNSDAIKPDVGINMKVNASLLEGGAFEVVLEVEVDAKNEKNQMFLCQIQYAALISVIASEDKSDADAEEVRVRKILLEECPQIMFPFARNIIADTTRDSGFHPLLLQPVDFSALNKAKKGGRQASEDVAD